MWANWDQAQLLLQFRFVAKYFVSFIVRFYFYEAVFHDEVIVVDKKSDDENIK